MQQITIDIATPAEAARVRDALCGRFLYDEQKLEGESRASFAKRKVAEWVANIVVSWETEEAQKAVEAPTEPQVS